MDLSLPCLDIHLNTQVMLQQNPDRVGALGEEVVGDVDGDQGLKIKNGNYNMRKTEFC